MRQSNVDNRFAQILRSNLRPTWIERTPFELALEDAWSSASAVESDLPAILTDEQRARIAQIKGRWKGYPSEGMELLLGIFHALPEPMLVHSGGRFLRNRPFDELLDEEGLWQRGLPVFEQIPVLKRFSNLLAHGQKINVQRILMPLADRAWDVQVRVFDDVEGSAIYLRPISLSLEGLGPMTRLVLLYTLSGLTMEQTAWLTDLKQHQVNYHIRKHRNEILELRRSLCPAPPP